MAVFAYRATDPAGGPAVRGVLAADSPRHARDLLRDRGLAPVEVREQAASASAAGGGSSPGSLRERLPGGRGSVRRTASAVRELSTLLGVGVPLAEALGVVAAGHPGRLGEALLGVRDRVGAGVSLAEAFAGRPRLFDPLAVKMAEVGEKSGNLDAVLARLADFREAGLELRDRVTTALLYPAFVLVAAIGVSLFLMTAVVPTLLEGLLEAGRPLPWPTKVLKALSDGLLAH
ncbi:type II secretion system F family protein, partial [Alienimonas sp. DA493]|uniref:type II secretion system F family protein n=1 Tax=Alienimonas sp. DA493 TaxID=3373605 RepID=UPI0037542C6C